MSSVRLSRRRSPREVCHAPAAPRARELRVGASRARTSAANVRAAADGVELKPDTRLVSPGDDQPSRAARMNVTMHHLGEVERQLMIVRVAARGVRHAPQV